MMCLATELWSALHGVATAAKREKVPGPLVELGNDINQCLEELRSSSEKLRWFSQEILPSVKNIVAGGNLPLLTQEACEELEMLLEGIVKLCV